MYSMSFFPGDSVTSTTKKITQTFTTAVTTAASFCLFSIPEQVDAAIRTTKTGSSKSANGVCTLSPVHNSMIAGALTATTGLIAVAAYTVGKNFAHEKHNHNIAPHDYAIAAIRGARPGIIIGTISGIILINIFPPSLTLLTGCMVGGTVSGAVFGLEGFGFTIYNRNHSQQHLHKN